MLKKFNYKLGHIYLILKIFFQTAPRHLYLKLLLNTLKNFLRLYTPSSAVLALTYKCQCRCIHCSAGFYKKDFSNELSTKEWFNLLDDIADIGVPRINITGGEALLRSDIFPIIEYASKKFIVILESNGQLLTQENLEKLKKSKVSCIAVSLDDFDPDSHDRMRNLEGCFQNAVQGILNVRSYKIPCILSTYVTSEKATPEYLNKIISLAKQLKVQAVRILPSRPAGSFSCRTDSLLTKAQEDDLINCIDSRKAYYKGIPSPKQCGLFCKATFYISPYGEVQLCPYLPFSFGNINNSTLFEILRRMWKHAIFNRKHKDCLILNDNFRNEKITPFLNKDYVFPIEI